MIKKCICIKNYKLENLWNTIIFSKGKIYEYQEYYSNVMDINHKHYKMFIDDMSLNTWGERRYLSFTKDEFKINFITLNKLRKKKLEQLKKASL